MGRYHSAVPCFSLSWLVCLSINGGLARCLELGDCSSSCGNLQGISYPFRLKGDPVGCGDPRYELVCKGNKAMLNSSNLGDLEVTEINSYICAYIKKIRVVVVELASGRCRLPSRSLLPVEVRAHTNWKVQAYQPITSQSLYWESSGSFVNCSRKVDDPKYHRVPCLSRSNTNVYFVYSTEISDLKPSCHSLVELPVDEESWRSNSDEDIFQVLQKGFYLKSGEFRAITHGVGACWNYAFQYLRRMIRNGYYKGFKMLSILIFYENEFVTCIFPNIGIPGGVILTAILLLAQLLVVLALMGRLIFAPLCIFMFLAHKLRGTLISIDMVEKFLQNQQTLMPTKYTYSDIIAMTGHFREKLGQGGFGSVFKGNLPGGFMVAVKMLGNSKCNGEDFINEVSTIGRIHHVNVVGLIGFCSEGTNRSLVYEYMPNGSLDKYIFSKGGRDPPFTGEKLVEIALGTARGIEYLHLGCDMRILHFDIKPHNILLDSNFTPKVSDFGLAKLYSKDYSLVSVSAARGTIGYIAPELISRSFGVITTKSDVYSFGMLLLEMAGGRRNANPQADNSSQAYFPSWIYDQLNQVEELQIENVPEIIEEKRKLCLVGLWCIQMKSSDRPSMSEVVSMLEGSTDALQMPPKPFLSSPQPVPLQESSLNFSLEELSIISE